MDIPSIDEKRLEQRPVSGEAPFAAGEVFYSRTDRRGVIRSGNYIFRRVAGYEWEELIGAPHRIIRHPDMPKAVFWLLWDRIQRGEVVGAYVKNRAKDGLYYWVFAIVTPWKDGYLSARIKPTSGLRETVERLYGQLLAGEKSGLTPQQSAEVLLAELGALGFATYDDFMTHACSEELLAECRAMGLPPDKRIMRAGRILKLATKLAEDTDSLVEEFENLGVVPHNLRLAAARLEPSGGPISTLSRNYGEISKDMSDWFQETVIGSDSDFANIKRATKQAMLMECAASVLFRCEQQLQAERRRLGETDIEKECDYLSELAEDYIARARAAASTLIEETVSVAEACQKLRRDLLALNATRVACKIENARLGSHIKGLEDIIERFGESQVAIGESLGAIEGNCAAIIGEWEKRDERADVPKELLFGQAMAGALAGQGKGA